MDEFLKFIAKFVVVFLLAMVAVYIGGPLLALYVLIVGWVDADPKAKAGAIILPIVGVVWAYLSFQPTTIQGQESLQDFFLFILSPLLSFGLLGIAYLRREIA